MQSSRLPKLQFGVNESMLVSDCSSYSVFLRGHFDDWCLATQCQLNSVETTSVFLTISEANLPTITPKEWLSGLADVLEFSLQICSADKELVCILNGSIETLEMADSQLKLVYLVDPNRGDYTEFSESMSL